MCWPKAQLRFISVGPLTCEVPSIFSAGNDNHRKLIVFSEKDCIL